MKPLTLFLFLLSMPIFAQKSIFFSIDSLPVSGVLLDKGWKYQTGDKLDWAKPDLDDSAWTPIDPTKEIVTLPQVFNAQIKWLRLNFELKNKLSSPLGIAIRQAGASEIYLNGQLIQQFGHFNTDSSKVRAYDPLQIPIYLPADSAGQYTLAVRYALQPDVRYTNIYNLTKNPLFTATLFDLVPTLHAQKDFKIYYKGIEIFAIGIFLILLIIHIALFVNQPSNKTSLVFALYLFVAIFVRSFKIIGESQSYLDDRYISLNISNWSLALLAICLSTVYYRISQASRDIYYYIIVAYSFMYSCVSSLVYSAFPWQNFLLLIGSIFNFIIWIRLTRMGYKKGIRGFLVLNVAIMFSLLGLASRTIVVHFLNYGITPIGYNALDYGISPYWLEAIIQLGGIAIPIGLSLFMGIQGNETNKALSKQLLKNDQLKNEAIELEQEKQHILATQNETLEKQVTERTAELNQSLDVLKATQNQLIQSEKLANLGELTAGIAHEIQNPLNFVINFSELSLNIVKDLKDEMEAPLIDKAYIDELFNDLSANQEKINHHGKRASSIVKGMLAHSRASTGIRELSDINKLADEYLRLSYHGLRAKDKTFNANFTSNFADPLPKIEVIPQDLGRVLMNLINNAFYAVNEKRVKNTQAGYQPLVSVSTEQIDSHIIIKISDNGIGIPENIKEKIFKPFFTTKPTGQGTGLGLSLSYDIITKGHGGSLEVESEMGAFTLFIIKLPLSLPQPK
jgi:two-component system NtrC family sensor kinase